MLVVNGLAESGEGAGGESTTSVACGTCWCLDVSGLHVCYNSTSITLQYCLVD